MRLLSLKIWTRHNAQTVSVDTLGIGAASRHFAINSPIWALETQQNHPIQVLEMLLLEPTPHDILASQENAIYFYERSVVPT